MSYQRALGKKSSVWACACLLAVVLSVPSLGFAQGPPYAFTKLQYPGSTYTHGYAINNSGTVVGTYQDTAGVLHAFTYTAGVYANVNFPGATHSYALGINDLGHIVGSHSNDGLPGPWHSFLLKDGVYEEFDPPGWESDARNINNLGTLVGVYNAGGSLPTHGFIRSAAGTFTTIDYPGALYTFPGGINDLGKTSGAFIDALGKYHGFLYSNGQFSTFDYPGALATFAVDINNLGDVVGMQTQAGTTHAFIFSGTSFRAFDVSFAGTTETRAKGINDLGHVVGTYLGPDCLGGCGFVAVPQPTTPTCKQTVGASFAAGTLTLNFTLQTAVSTSWDTYLLIQGTVVRLWSATLPAIVAPGTVNIPNVPPLGIIAALSMLSTPELGVACADFAVVNTGTP